MHFKSIFLVHVVGDFSRPFTDHFWLQHHQTNHNHERSFEDYDCAV